MVLHFNTKTLFYYGFCVLFFLSLFGWIVFSRPTSEVQPIPVPTPVVQESPTPQTRVVPSVANNVEPALQDPFYQTIIDNNIFAPLGTVLNTKPSPGAHLSVLATFTNTSTGDSMALLKDSNTGQQAVVAVGKNFGEFTLTAVAAKNVTVQHKGTSVRLSLSPTFFLNTQRRK